VFHLNVSKAGKFVVSIPLKMEYDEALSVRDRLELTRKKGTKDFRVLKEALATATVDTVEALLKAKVFPAVRICDAAPVLYTLSVYRDLLTMGACTPSEAAQEVERLERLMIHTLGWRDWRAASIDRLDLLARVIVEDEQYRIKPVRDHYTQALGDLSAFLYQCTEFTKIPKALCRRLETAARKAETLRQNLISIDRDEAIKIAIILGTAPPNFEDPFAEGGRFGSATKDSRADQPESLQERRSALAEVLAHHGSLSLPSLQQGYGNTAKCQQRESSDLQRRREALDAVLANYDRPAARADHARN